MYDELLKFSIYFHGHLGPFLVLGLRAGLLANKLIGRNPLSNLARVRLPLKKPYSCFLDGIQISTGCTLGKLNIVALNDSEIVVEIQSNSRLLVINVRKSIIKEIMENLKSISAEKEAEKIWKYKDIDLFIWKIFRGSFTR